MTSETIQNVSWLLVDSLAHSYMNFKLNLNQYANKEKQNQDPGDNDSVVLNRLAGNGDRCFGGG